MIPEFPRIEAAIRYTTEYFNIGRIASLISKFSGGLNLDYLDTYYEVTMKFHEHMEKEINQNIHGSYRNIKIAMFEYLKDWLYNDWRFSPDYSKTILWLIDEYNVKNSEDYTKKIIEDEDKFKTTEVYKKAHGEIYEVTRQSTFLIGGLYLPVAKKQVTNSWFYCNEKKPELIDESYLPQYYKLVNGIIESFKRASVPYVEKYNSGIYNIDKEIIIERQIITNQRPTKLLTSADSLSIGVKLKMNLSVPQLAYLFKMLLDSDLISPGSKAALARFISSNFYTHSSEEISVKTLINCLSDTEKTVADFWVKKLIDLRKLAQNV